MPLIGGRQRSLLRRFKASDLLLEVTEAVVQLCDEATSVQIAVAYAWVALRPVALDAQRDTAVTCREGASGVESSRGAGAHGECREQRLFRRRHSAHEFERRWDMVAAVRFGDRTGPTVPTDSVGAGKIEVDFPGPERIGDMVRSNKALYEGVDGPPRP